MKLYLTNQSGTYDLTQLVRSVKWSGDRQQAARSLEASVLTSPTDPNVPVVDCTLGSGIQMYEGGDLLFDGFVVSRTKSTGSSTMPLLCQDRGRMLNRNYEIYKFENTTAEAAAKRIAGDFGIPVGSLAATGVQLTRLFLTGKDSLYAIIQTMYYLASQSTGKKYHIGFRGSKLYVTEKAPDDRTLIIQGKSNLIAATHTESVENLVSSVRIYDENLNHVRDEEDSQLSALYGRMQQVLIQNQKDDKSAEARSILEENGVTQKNTLDNLGNAANVTGGTVVVREPYTGLYGLFYIDSDIHEWKRGQYYNKLVVNFQNIMDAKEAGSLPNADGSKTSVASAGSVSSSDTGSGWSYVNQIQ